MQLSLVAPKEVHACMYIIYVQYGNRVVVGTMRMATQASQSVKWNQSHAREVGEMGVVFGVFETIQKET